MLVTSSLLAIEGAEQLICGFNQSGLWQFPVLSLMEAAQDFDKGLVLICGSQGFEAFEKLLYG
jgi:hypothetical protein